MTGKGKADQADAADHMRMPDSGAAVVRNWLIEFADAIEIRKNPLHPPDPLFLISLKPNELSSDGDFWWISFAG